MSAATRRRRLALGLLAAGALAAGIAVGADRDGSGQPSESVEEGPSCPREIASDPGRLTGQMLIVRMEAKATDVLRERVRTGEIGGVILFPPEGTDPETLGDQIALLRHSAERAGMPQPLIATDQEGGEVKRLPALPPERSPAETTRAAAAAAEGAATGRALRDLGIDVDLAPVLDVPGVDGAFIASRAYSDDAAVAAELGTAFGAALQSPRARLTGWAQLPPLLSRARAAKAECDPGPSARLCREAAPNSCRRGLLGTGIAVCRLILRRGPFNDGRQTTTRQAPNGRPKLVGTEHALGKSGS